MHPPGDIGSTKGGCRGTVIFSCIRMAVGDSMIPFPLYIETKLRLNTRDEFYDINKDLMSSIAQPGR